MLKKQYDEKLAQKEELRKKSEEMELKLERAGLLVTGLAGEKARWEETAKVRSAAPPASSSSLTTGSKNSHPLPTEGTVRENGDTWVYRHPRMGSWSSSSPTAHIW